ncbi:MAG: hypothetical protein U0W24_09025 [Bacteroidales bacterium]
MAQYTNKYSQQVFEILSPLLGNIMAQSIINIHTLKVGKNPETLTNADIQKFSESIQNGITIFLGTDVAKTVGTKISKII